MNSFIKRTVLAAVLASAGTLMPAFGQSTGQGTVAGPNYGHQYQVGALAQVTQHLCYSDPAREFFMGTITATGTPGATAIIGYQWVHSDGSIGAVGSVSLKVPESSSAKTDEWQNQASGWAELQVTSINGRSRKLVSNQATFTCTQGAAPSQPSPPAGSGQTAGGGGSGISPNQYRNRIMNPTAQVPPVRQSMQPTAPNFRPAGPPHEPPPSMYRGPAAATAGSASGATNGIRVTIKISAGACAKRNPRPQFFVGSLYINGNGPLNNIPITYVWKRSDGAVNNPPLSANVTSAHQLNLRDEWNPAPASGWEVVQVTSVNGQSVDVESNRAVFSCSTASAPSAPPR